VKQRRQPHSFPVLVPRWRRARVARAGSAVHGVVAPEMRSAWKSEGWCDSTMAAVEDMGNDEARGPGSRQGFRAAATRPAYRRRGTTYSLKQHNMENPSDLRQPIIVPGPGEAVPGPILARARRS